MELTFTAWDLLPLANDVWINIDQSVKQLLVNQWKDNTDTIRGYQSRSLLPENAGTPGPNGFPYPPFKWDENRRARLRAELDGLYAHLYGLHRDELSYILDTFPIVRRNDEARYGEYRTKRLVLEAYDELAGSDLIPAEARERSKHSVLGERTTVPVLKPAPGLARPKPKQKDREAETGPAAQRIAGERIEPNAGTALPAEPTPAEASPEPPPEPEDHPVVETPPPATDWGWYRCSACGKRVLGFMKEDHTKEAHGGKAPEYTKIS